MSRRQTGHEMLHTSVAVSPTGRAVDATGPVRRIGRGSGCRPSFVEDIPGGNPECAALWHTRRRRILDPDPFSSGVAGDVERTGSGSGDPWGLPGCPLQ